MLKQSFEYPIKHYLSEDNVAILGHKLWLRREHSDSWARGLNIDHRWKTPFNPLTDEMAYSLGNDIHPCLLHKPREGKCFHCYLVTSHIATSHATAMINVCTDTHKVQSWEGNINPFIHELLTQNV